MGTVGRGPEHVDRLAAGSGARLYLPDVGFEVPRLRMVRLVYGKSDRIVVDRDVNGPAERGLEACARSTAAREEIDNEPRHAATGVGFFSSKPSNQPWTFCARVIGVTGVPLPP